MVLLPLLLLLNPKEAIGASSQVTELTPTQKLAANPGLAYKGVRLYQQPQGWGCVGYLRKRGYYVPRTLSGGAGSIPVDSTELPPEGEYVVIVTHEGPIGHVALATNIGGVLIVREEGSFGKTGGRGRVVPLSQYKGYIFSIQPVEEVLNV